LSGQLDVEQDEVGRSFLDPGQRFRAVPGQEDVVPLLLKDLAQERANARVVIDDEHTRSALVASHDSLSQTFQHATASPKNRLPLHSQSAHLPRSILNHNSEIASREERFCNNPLPWGPPPVGTPAPGSATGRRPRSQPGGTSPPRR